jgi:hypothetical protein
MDVTGMGLMIRTELARARGLHGLAGVNAVIAARARRVR